MSKVLFTAILVVVAAMMGIVNVVDAQSGSSYYGNGYNYGYQPSNYLSAYPQQFAYGDGSTPGDSWHQSLASTLWP
uniref:Salivary secreted peptide n=1 Tax=Panagrellus redivivus TaxID=6233 RepID=A0A7E4V041_PANRE